MPQQTQATPRLLEAIEEYRTHHNEELDEHADKVLSRLADSSAAAEAFERLKPTDDREVAVVRARQSARTRSYLKRLERGNPQVFRAIEQQLKTQNRDKAVAGQAAIIRACIQAENLVRTFPKRVKKAKEILKRRRKPLRKAVNTLRSFLNEIISEQQEPPNPLWIRPKPAEDVAVMGLGLATFERWIEYEKNLANLNLFRLRVSRKSRALGARQVAAIGWFAEEVKRVTGKAHYGEIADLVGVLLEREIFPEQVRYAAERARGHWKWVKPNSHSAVRSRVN